MKTCSECKESLPLAAFNKRSASKDGLQSKCSDCNRKYYKKYYAGNEKEQLRLKRRNKEHKDTVRDYLRQEKSKPCKDCGKTLPYYVMQFDHLRDKKFHLSTSMNFYSLEKIKEEVAKCEVVCSNCHAERTYKRRFESLQRCLSIPARDGIIE